MVHYQNIENKQTKKKKKKKKTGNVFLCILSQNFFMYVYALVLNHLGFNTKNKK